MTPRTQRIWVVLQFIIQLCLAAYIFNNIKIFDWANTWWATTAIFLLVVFILLGCLFYMFSRLIDIHNQQRALKRGKNHDSIC